MSNVSRLSQSLCCTIASCTHIAESARSQTRVKATEERIMADRKNDIPGRRDNGSVVSRNECQSM